MDASAPGGAQHLPTSTNAPGNPGPYFGGPPPPKNRPWFPLAVVAAILIAGALIAAAIFFKDSGQPATQPTPSSPAAPAAPTSGPRGAQTCAAWTIAKSDFRAIPKLPPGWDYQTPGIDAVIASRVAQVDKVLRAFEAQIAPTPVDVAAAAQLFVEKQQAEVTKLPAHTFDSADVYAIDGAYRALDRACGMG